MHTHSPIQKSLLSNKKGFTLIELLLIFTLLAMLGIAAVSSYFDSTGTFGFISRHKSVLSVFRTARNYAVTNKAVNVGGTLMTPDRYGVAVIENGLALFADVGDIPFQYDLLGDEVILEKAFDFTENNHAFVMYDSNGSKLEFPVNVFYEKTSGEFSVFHNVPAEGPTLLPKTEASHIYMVSSDLDEELTRYIVIYQISGLPEDFLEWPLN